MNCWQPGLSRVAHRIRDLSVIQCRGLTDVISLGGARAQRLLRLRARRSCATVVACADARDADRHRVRAAVRAPHIQAAIFTGSYAVIFGLALTLAPKTIFGLLFGSETVSSGWIRVGGILFTLIGWQYLGTGLADRQGYGALGFYKATIWSRVALSAAFALLVVLRESPAGLLVLAAINLAGAISMHWALKRRETAEAAGELAGAGEQADGGSMASRAGISGT